MKAKDKNLFPLSLKLDPSAAASIRAWNPIFVHKMNSEAEMSTVI
jgi:hypothetical protein